MKPVTIWSRSFFPVLVAYFIDNFGLAIVYPIFTPLFLEPHVSLLGADISLFHRTFLLGLLIASFPLAQFFGAPIFGELSDRWGRKKVFIITITGGVIGYFLTGLGIHFKELHLLWIGRATTGFFAGNLTLCLAAIADITKTKQERTRNFGWVGTVGGLGFILAILTGGSLSNPDLEHFFRPEVPFFITGFLALLNLGLIIRYFKESHIEQKHDRVDFFLGLKNIGKAVGTKYVRRIYLVYFLFIVCWVSSMQFLSANLIDLFRVSENTITTTFIFIGITWSFANFIINPILSGLLPAARTFLFGLMFLSLFLFLTRIPHTPLFLFLVHFFLATFFAALCWTNGLATISLCVSKSIQGSVLGINQSIVAIASIVGPVVSGIIAGINIHNLYVFTGACSLAAALLLFMFPSVIKKT